MIKAEMGQADWQVAVTDGVHEMLVDTTPEHGGTWAGFRPFHLLEAALAGCINITLRMYAQKIGANLTGVKVEVELKRDDPNKSVFEYKIELQGELSEEQRTKLMRAAKACPVHKTLVKEVEVREAI